MSGETLTRGQGYLSDAAKDCTRVPTGHPEGYLEAFATIYCGVVLLINAAVVATGLMGRAGRRGDGPAGLTSRRFEPLATRTRQLLDGRSLWMISTG